MSVNQNLVNEFLNIAIDELVTTGLPVTPQSHHRLIKSWCDDFEDDTKRNRLETEVLDALEEARDRLWMTVRSISPAK